MCTAPNADIQEVADLLRPLAADPPPQHWLDSNHAVSYCWPCARKARWHELGNVGDPPAEVDWFRRDVTEQAIRDGIDGGDWYSGTADSPVACATCGCTLAFTLTECGVDYTMEGFEAGTLHPDNLTNPETVYELQRVFDQGAWATDPNLLAAVAATAAETKSLLAALPAHA
jgi:hypothetical protein